MMIEDFRLQGGLSEEQIDVMHERALSLVEEVGVQIPHDGILRLLSDYDGVTIEKRGQGEPSGMLEGNSGIESSQGQLSDSVCEGGKSSKRRAGIFLPVG